VTSERIGSSWVTAAAFCCRENGGAGEAIRRGPPPQTLSPAHEAAAVASPPPRRRVKALQRDRAEDSGNRHSAAAGTGPTLSGRGRGCESVSSFPHEPLNQRQEEPAEAAASLCAPGLHPPLLIPSQGLLPRGPSSEPLLQQRQAHHVKELVQEPGRRCPLARDLARRHAARNGANARPSKGRMQHGWGRSNLALHTLLWRSRAAEKAL
jgi:hypothetical protein